MAGLSDTTGFRLIVITFWEAGVEAEVTRDTRVVPRRQELMAKQVSG